jgi:hypothetical protein
MMPTMRRAVLLSLLAAACAGADAHGPTDTTAGTATATSSDDADGDDANDPDDDAGDAATTDTADDASSSGDDGASGPPTLVRIGDTFAISTLAASQPKRFVDAANDPVGDVYLVVNGNAAISGSFLDANGVALGEPFALAETDAYTQGVRVAFGGDAFLVAWHDNREDSNSARLRARSVAWTGTPVLGADVEIGTGATFSEMPPAIAWSETSSTFLVAWHTAVADDIHAQRVASDGSRIGGEIVVTNDIDWQSDVGLAWNPVLDEWLVAYTHAGATTEVRVRRIAADGTVAAGETSMTTAAGTWLAHAAFVPDAGEYLVAWYEGAIAARRVEQDGTPIGDAFVLAPGYGSYDGFAMAYSPVTATFAAVFHGTTDEDFAVAFTADGMQSEVVEATSSRGRDGHFNPRVVAHATRPEWLLVTSLGFATVVGQRLGP